MSATIINLSDRRRDQVEDGGRDEQLKDDVWEQWPGLTNRRAKDQVEDFRRRLIQEVMAHGTSRYWRRRAATFEWARPRAGDYLGTGGQAHADELDARLVATRDACLQRATRSELHELS